MQEDRKKNKVLELATFYIGDALCGIDILNIQEINRNMDIAWVPHAKEYVKGVLNLRGQIVTVIDLGKKLGLAPANTTSENRNIIVNSQDEYIGFLIDQISDVLLADPDKIEPAPANISGVKGKYFQGVLKTESSLIGILSIDAVLMDE